MGSEAVKYGREAGGNSGRYMATALVMLLVGCGNDGAENSSSQVVARVNDSEITLTQLQQQIQMRPPEAAGRDESVQKRVLDGLIDQELLRQKAIEQKLDRDPDIVLRLQAAQSRVLADAYVQHKVIPRTRISREQIEIYFVEHPELFRQRRHYALVVFNVEQPLPPAIVQQWQQAQTKESIGKLLRERDIKYQVTSLQRLADQLPLSVIAQFTAAKPGDVVILKSPDGGNAVTLIESFEIAGLTLEEASPAIENYLTNIRNETAYRESLDRLRTAAAISYETIFAEAAPSAPPQSAAQAISNAAVAAPASAATDQPATAVGSTKQ